MREPTTHNARLDARQIYALRTRSNDDREKSGQSDANGKGERDLPATSEKLIALLRGGKCVYRTLKSRKGGSVRTRQSRFCPHFQSLDRFKHRFLAKAFTAMWFFTLYRAKLVFLRKCRSLHCQ